MRPEDDRRLMFGVGVEWFSRMGIMPLTEWNITMINLNVQFQQAGDGSILDAAKAKGKTVREITGNVTLAVLDKGMESGKPSVALVMESDTEVLVLQTTARLFATAGRVITGRYPDLFED